MYSIIRGWEYLDVSSCLASLVSCGVDLLHTLATCSPLSLPLLMSYFPSSFVYYKKIR